MLMLPTVTRFRASAAVASKLGVASILLWRKDSELRQVCLQMGCANLCLERADLV